LQFCQPFPIHAFDKLIPDHFGKSNCVEKMICQKHTFQILLCNKKNR
jgi:hypothetical protein